ncbi:MAG: histidine kinase dimerization/phospho-acceptor domain-containing protein [Pseudomonadota bacterium]
MFFDDRLITVLRQRTESDVEKRIQFRQLIDLLGARHTGTREQIFYPSLIGAAWMRLDALGYMIPPADRARMIREPGWRFRNPELAAHLADFEPEVAASALARAQLSVDDWTALIPRLPVRARGFLRLRRDLPVDVEALLDQLGVRDRGLPSPADPAVIAQQNAAEARVDIVNPAEPEPDFAAPPPTPELEARSSNTQPPHDFSDPPPEEEAEEEPFMLATPGEDEPELSDEPDAEPDEADGLERQSTSQESDQDTAQDAGRSEISALVERIAQFRRDRDAGDGGDGADGTSMPRLPLGEEEQEDAREVLSFGFSADARGRIDWADDAVAPMVVGTRLVRPIRAGPGSEAQESAIERAVSRRQPVANAPMMLDGAPQIAGDWIVDAQPRFSDGGHFAGYIGRFRRPVSLNDDRPSAAQREADRIRQLLHELRTPVTAVQGYAEVIQQQILGIVPHEYRALAAAITADAARILAGFEELDRLARLETGGMAIARGAANFSGQVERTVNQLKQVLAPRMAGIVIESAPPEPLEVAMAPDEAETMLWRLLATLAGGCAAGEMLEAELTTQDDLAALTCEMPALLLREADVFTAEARPIGTTINAGLFGAGFALRLVRAEARAVGGDLLRDGESLMLTVPQVLALTEPADRQDGGG